MVASFASLPAELVGQVAGMVHEQDRAWQALEIEQGRPRRSVYDDVMAGTPQPSENIPLGRWSSEYGHGIRALVQVDRRTREEAVPFLYKSITARAANAPYFRVKVIGRDLGRLVHELDCKSVKPDQVISVAAALEGLPNLSLIKVAGECLDLLEEGGVGPEQELLVQAMRSALGRITSLEIGLALSSSVAHALSYVDKRRFSRLVVADSRSLAPVEQELVDALEGLEGLVDVELDAWRDEDFPEMERRLRLPHLRTLTLRYKPLGFEPEYSDGLLLAHRVAPALEALSFVGLYDDNRRPDPPPALPRSLLSRLRILRINTIEPHEQDLNRLHLDRLPALEHLDISSESNYGDIFPDETSLPTFPSTLQAITFANTLPIPPSPPASLVAKCDKIRLFSPWSPPAIYYARSQTEHTEPPLGGAFGAPTEHDAVDLKRLFDWASARAGWLLRVGDGRAMEELAAAALRLRERFAIEHS